MITGRQRQLVETILKNGKVESYEIEALRQEFGDGSNITRAEADLLVELFKRVQRRSPGFEDYFYRSIENYTINQGTVNADLAAWLRQLFVANGPCGSSARKVLHEIKGQLKNVSPAFQTLLEECASAA